MIPESIPGISPDEIEQIPRKTGCYIFKGQFGSSDQEDRVLYVGKAKDLRSRVKQYFSKEGDGRAFVQYIKNNTKRIEYIIVGNDQDAFVLENELIKRFKPAFNIHLKDDKRYLSLRLDLEHEWPYIQIVRRVKKERAVYLGPFSSASRLRETLNTLQKIFPLRSCPDSKLYNRSRPCLEYDIKRCVAPCVGYVSQDDYRKLVDSTHRFLKGESEELLCELEKEMKRSAEVEHFEQAAQLRDRIEAIRQITQSTQSIISHQARRRAQDIDVMGLSTEDSRAIIYLLFIRNGVIWDARSFEFNHVRIDDSELILQFLHQYYSQDVYEPHEVILPRPVESRFDWPFQITTAPRAKEKKKFLEMAEENARQKLNERRERDEKISAVLESIQTKLNLSRIPKEMDCFDISHHHGKEVVASVVRFSGGVPEKSLYRKIYLRNQMIDDFESMREAVARRYKTNEELPDLIMVDGGKGQLRAAEQVLKELEYFSSVDLIALAKARPEAEVRDPFNPMNRERVFKPGRKNPILLPENSKEELLLSYLRDEAHRFAINYHRKKKTEAVSSSLLDQVKGLGSRQKLKLLKTYQSLEAIQNAPDSELLQMINRKTLRNLRVILSSSEEEN